MKRFVIFPGANDKLVQALQARLNTAKEPGDTFTAQAGPMEYTGPIEKDAVSLRWTIATSKAVAPKPAPKPPAKKAAKKTAKKAAKAKPAKAKDAKPAPAKAKAKK